MTTKVLSSIAALIIVIGLVFIVTHHSSPSPSTLPSTTTPTTTTPTTTSPATSSTTTLPLSSAPSTAGLSASCIAALAPAIEVLTKDSEHTGITTAMTRILATSMNAAYRICPPAQYDLFYQRDYTPYLKKTK